MVKEMQFREMDFKRLFLLSNYRNMWSDNPHIYGKDIV